MKKGFLDISFSWIFAIIIGAFILFFAITSISKLGNIKQTSQGAEAGVELEILLNPLETGLETGRTSKLTMPIYSRIYMDCDTYGDFGNHHLMVQEEVKKEWQSSGINIKFQNKYLFSDSIIEGREFYLFTKPLEMPFKVGTLIYMTSSEKEYCFKDPPEKIAEELIDLGQANIIIDHCEEEHIQVCFGGGNDCDIEVDHGRGQVKKEENNLYFSNDALMYAAIFSSPTIYECELKRVLKKVSKLATIYQEKATLIVDKGCTSRVIPELTSLKQKIENFQSSSELNSLYNTIQDLEKKNENAGNCRLW